MVLMNPDVEEIPGVGGVVGKGKETRGLWDRGQERKPPSWSLGGAWRPGNAGLIHVRQSVWSEVRLLEEVSTAGRGNGSLGGGPEYSEDCSGLAEHGWRSSWWESRMYGMVNRPQRRRRDVRGRCAGAPLP